MQKQKLVQRKTKKRSIDEAVDGSSSWLKKKIVLINKKNVKTWHGVAIIAFIAGITVSTIWMTRLDTVTHSQAVNKSSSDNKLDLNSFLANPPKDPDGKDQHFEKITTDNEIVLFSQRMIDNAVVEKDQSVYVFNKSNGKFKEKKIKYRSGLPKSLPLNLLTKEKAEAQVNGNSKFSTLYYASPDSDVFNINFDKSNPIWAVTSFDSNNYASLFVIDAITGKKLGNGNPPPSSGYSMTGPISYGSSCSDSWSSWSSNAASWYQKMGYTTETQTWPLKTQEMAKIQDPNIALFYELAHGASTIFINSCSESTYASDIKNWLSSYPAKKFAFIGSCDGLCSTGAGSFSYEFRKGSSTDTATIGYCGMSSSACSSCWTVSLNWQDNLFNYMNQGLTVKNAFDKANIDYPSCRINNCMRFAGDTNLVITDRTPDTQPPTISITSPANNSTVSGIVTMQANATDNVGISKVEFYANNSLLSSDTSAPYSFSFNSNSVQNGNVSLSAIAYDAANNKSSSVITVSVNNATDTVSPSVTISTPTDGAIVSGIVSIKASATDNVAVVGMYCYIDNVKLNSSTSDSLSCSWNTKKVATGAHVIMVKANDATGNTDYKTITVNLQSSNNGKKN
ncbi:MAG: Ig-like domain-containing protein [Parcubacteria group bacterium]|jgi:hypothetical protein